MKPVAQHRSLFSHFMTVVSLAMLGPFTAAGADYEFHPFQAPGALDTLPFGISNQGLVTGLWYPEDFTPEGFLTVEHGFLYTVEGGLVTVDFPGVPYTLMYQVNQRGEVAAGIGTETGTVFGAVYDSRRNTWTVLPDPDPFSVASQAVGMNDRGQLFGYWSDNPFFLNNHGWVYSRGEYTFFDAPGASPDAFGTIVNSANNRGDVVGVFYDSDFGGHGFIRYGNDGRIETIDVPTALPGSTSAFGINDQGTIVGRYIGHDGRVHGFILSMGVYTTFDAPGAVNTVLTAINNRGDLVGFTFPNFIDPRMAFIAFRRSD